jgi:hypothetical protein
MPKIVVSEHDVFRCTRLTEPVLLHLRPFRRIQHACDVRRDHDFLVYERLNIFAANARGSSVKMDKVVS